MPGNPATEIDELIARLESATEGSRELDGDIAEALGFYRIRRTYDGVFVTHKDGVSFEADRRRHWVFSSVCPCYSASLDDALLLLPSPLWTWTIGHFWSPEDGYYGSARIVPDRPGPSFHGTGKSPALALCMAALKAHLVTHPPTSTERLVESDGR